MAVRQVSAAVELLDGGATVPFIARYRKEATGTLDDAQLRTLDERLRYLRELDERRDAILKEITAQGKLTGELEAQIRAADSKARLEDLYLPYKPKRRTKAQIAREAGLEPLADLLLGDPSQDPQQAAQGFLNENVPDVIAALEGARAILVERFAEDADLIGQLREAMAARGTLISKVREGQDRKRREVRRLLRVQRALRPAARAPHPGPVPRREGGGPRPHARSGGRRRGHRGDHRGPLRPARRRPARRPVAGRHRALGLAHPHPDPPERRRPGPAVAAGRGRGGPCVRGQRARPAAGRPGGRADHDRPGPGLPDRGQGRRHRRDRQGDRDRDHLPARAAAALGRGPRHPRETGQGTTTPSSSRSATAPPRGRPTGWPPT